MSLRTKILPAAAAFLFIWVAAAGQNVRPGTGERIFVRGGVADAAVENKAKVDLAKMTPDSLFRFMAAIDSLRNDGVRFDRAEMDSIVTAMIDRTSPTGDSLSEEQMWELVAKRRQQSINPATVRMLMDDRQFLDRYVGGGVDTLIPKLFPADSIVHTKRDLRREAKRDPDAYRYSRIFRDTIPLSPLIAISAVVPGFSQLYNGHYWKIPVLYGAVGAGIGLGIWQTSKWRPYKRLYDHYIRFSIPAGSPGFEEYREVMTQLQGRMIRHNTYRQLAFGFAGISYIYFLVDGTLNYPSKVNDIKKATTLATVCPGAGQIYNRNYWKVPIVVGGAAALLYCVDFNNRGYTRFKTALEYRTDDLDETVDEFTRNGISVSDSDLLYYKNSYRRNRDLCIILTGLFYLVQIIDAHATAHMKTYDISDDLSRVEFTPSVGSYFAQRAGGNFTTLGFSLNIKF